MMSAAFYSDSNPLLDNDGALHSWPAFLSFFKAECLTLGEQ